MDDPIYSYIHSNVRTACTAVCVLLHVLCVLPVLLQQAESAHLLHQGTCLPRSSVCNCNCVTTQHAAAACRCTTRSCYNVQPLQPHLSSSSHTCHRRLPPASCLMPLQMPRQQGGTTAAGGRRRTRLSRALGSSNWEVEFKDITMLKPIGEGAFGRVGCKDSKRNSDRRINSGEMSGGAVCACVRMPFISGEGAVRCICLRG